MSPVQAAKIRGCKTIIGVDRVASRLELAKSLGATHMVDTGSIKGTLIEEIRGITGGTGTTITVDASGAVPLIQQGVEFTANQGKMILLGIPPMDATLTIPLVPYTMVSTLNPCLLWIVYSRLHSRASRFWDQWRAAYGLSR